MATRIQVGNVLQESNGDEITVYVEQYGNEEINLVEISGKCCMLLWDPSTPGGRQQIRTLIDRLNEALAAHAVGVEQIYGELKVGDHCDGIRLPEADESNCAWHFNGSECSRPEHEDGHHVLVDDNYDVVAVHHVTPVDAAMAAYHATLPGRV